MTVRREADGALRAALARLPPGAGTQGVRAVLEAQVCALAAPLRVAVAGRVSSGKSTLVNALVGGDLMATGIMPVTFAVSVLRYAGTPSLAVHFTDRRPPLHLPVARLADVTARDASGNTATSGIDRVEVCGPYPYLRQFDLVDTPGFDSPHQEDTDEAMRALGTTPEEVTAVSARQLHLADAVVAVLNVGVSRPDADLLRRFHGDGGGFTSTPITSIAVLTKVEALWPGEIGRKAGDPLDTAWRHARRIMGGPETARLFHEVRPVCSKVALAAATFTEEDFADIAELALVEPATLERRLGHRTAFATRAYDDLPVPPHRRAGLAERFSPYGLALACRLVRDGVGDQSELRRELDERSGVPDLRAKLADRFGRRSDLIKLGRIVEKVRDIPRRLPAGMDPRDRAAVEDAVQKVTDLERHEPTFGELVALRRHYDGSLRLPADEADELEQVLGEHGRSIAARLGLPASAAWDDLERAALDRLDYWHRSPTEYAEGGRAAVRVVTRRYEQMYARLRQARAILEDDE
jgi:hypothetical protein